ncbi:MAG: DNA topoisomerase IV subunit A [Candidatus Aenigmarchaeota archaeon]|nr:DNA topoisomerase IV subunit A [Candidatus Aenigmarchaeota archaeon]
MVKKRGENTSKKIFEFAEGIVEQIKEEKKPKMKIPVRSLSNVEWSEDKGVLTLGNKKSNRYFFNVGHARKFMQTLLIASFCKDIVDENIHASIRDMYYNLKHSIGDSKENTFEEQSESDPLIVDIETALNLLREQLHLLADRKGVVVGNVKVRDRGDVIDWSKLGSGGWSIPSVVEDIEFVDVDADFALVIEKNAGFERLHEDKFWRDYNCILMGTGGQPARGTRRLIRRLAEEHKIPIYVLTDSDSYGWYIYSVIKSGSMALAHASDKLATPSAKFIGLTITDIMEYKLEKSIIRANDRDIKRAKEMLDYPWFQEKEWRRELKLMIDKRIKAEIEALSSRGLKFLTDTYLPEKLDKKEFLP